MRLSTQFSKISSLQRIDKASGIIYGVSVITEGEAKTHGTFVDSTTLDQVLTVALTHKDGVKVKADHGSGVMSIVGTLKNFSKDGKQLRADLHLMKEDEGFSKILEMAEKVPDAFGLSIAFSGKPEEVDQKKMTRCTELYSVDLTDEPAANPSGLFSKKGDNDNDADDNKSKSMSAEIEKLVKDELARIIPKDLETKLKAVETSVTTLSQRAANADALAQKAEIDSLMAEAGRDGRVVPLEADDLYVMKDGLCTIHYEPAKLRKMLSKLDKNKVNMSRKAGIAPTDKDGKPILKADERAEFYSQKRAEGAAELTRMISEQRNGN